MNASTTTTTANANVCVIEPSALALQPINFRQKWQPTVKGVMEDPKLAQAFFFEKAHGEFGELSPYKVFDVLASQFNKSYGLALSVQDAQEFLYERLWNEGSWQRLKSYSYKTDLRRWLVVVGPQLIHKRLIEDGIIRIRGNAGNHYRLRLLSQPYDIRVAVVNLMNFKDWRDFLYDYYVLKLSEQEIKEKLNIDGEEYKVLKKDAETKLITLLLETIEGNDFASQVLSVKKDAGAVIDVVPIDYVPAGHLLSDEESSLMEDFITAVGSNRNEFDAIDFSKDFVKTRLNFTDSDAKLLVDRFFFNVSPVEIAKAIGRTRAYVDNRFSVLRRRFIDGVRQWLYANRLVRA